MTFIIKVFNRHDLLILNGSSVPLSEMVSDRMISFFKVNYFKKVQ